MKCKGIGTSPGVALGRLRLYHPQETAVSRGLIAPEETEGEIASFLAARSEAITRADWALERLEGASRDIMLAQRDMLSDEAIHELNLEEYTRERYRDTLAQVPLLPEEKAETRRRREMSYLNLRWFMQTLLDRKDRMSMYHSLEVRVPFCDYRIAEYLYGVPWEFKDYQGQEKGLLRRAVEGLLPEPVLHRKKSPYPKTFDPRYEQLMETRLQTILDDPAAPLWQLVSAEEVKKLLHRETQWPWYGQLMRRPQTIAYLCQIDFWLRHYSVELVF